MKHTDYFVLEKNLDKDEFIKNALIKLSLSSDVLGSKFLEKSKFVEVKESFKEFSLVTFDSEVAFTCLYGNKDVVKDYVDWEVFPHKGMINVTDNICWFIDGKYQKIFFGENDDIEEVYDCVDWIQPSEVKQMRKLGVIQDGVDVNDSIIRGLNAAKPSFSDHGSTKGTGIPGDEYKNLVIDEFTNQVTEVTTFKVPFYELVLEMNKTKYSIGVIAVKDIHYCTINIPKGLTLDEDEELDDYDERIEFAINPYTKREEDFKKEIQPSEKILKFRKIRKPALIGGLALGFVLLAVGGNGLAALMVIGLILLIGTGAIAYILTKKFNAEEENRIKAEVDKLLAEQQINYDNWEKEHAKKANNKKDSLASTLAKFTKAKFSKAELNRIHDRLYDL